MWNSFLRPSEETGGVRQRAGRQKVDFLADDEQVPVEFEIQPDRDRPSGNRVANWFRPPTTNTRTTIGNRSRWK